MREGFAHGIVLYDSTDLVPFGGRLAAVPLSCLWACESMVRQRAEFKDDGPTIHASMLSETGLFCSLNSLEGVR